MATPHTQARDHQVLETCEPEVGVEEEFGAVVDFAWLDASYTLGLGGVLRTELYICVAGTTPGEPSEALAQFGKYEQMVMRMFCFALPHFPLLNGLVIRPRFKIRVFYVLEQESCGITIAFLPTDPYHPPRVNPAHRKLREQAVQLVP